MAEARKCDRCKKLYLPYQGKTNAKKVRMDTCNGFRFISSDATGILQSSDILDLCPECLKKLTDWFFMGLADSEGEN